VLQIESGDSAGQPFGFEDILPDAAIPQLLCEMEILPLCNGSEFASVSGEVIVEKVLIAKPRAARKSKRRRRND